MMEYYVAPKNAIYKVIFNDTEIRGKKTFSGSLWVVGFGRETLPFG